MTASLLIDATADIGVAVAGGLAIDAGLMRAPARSAARTIGGGIAGGRGVTTC